MFKNLVISMGTAGAIVIAVGGIFMSVEPAVGFAVAATSTSQFTITQVITAEISFKTPATNITLSPSIGGLTGGAASGTTQVVVTTNDSAGYTMTISASSSVGMIGNANGGTIPALVTGTPNVPDYNFVVPANLAYFGYTISASTTSELATIFKDNGTACNTGASDTLSLAHCWLNASTTPVTVISTTSSTNSSGSTSTLAFHVGVAANPTTQIPSDTYVATTTLTALAN